MFEAAYTVSAALISLTVAFFDVLLVCSSNAAAASMKLLVNGWISSKMGMQQNASSTWMLPTKVQLAKRLMVRLVIYLSVFTIASQGLPVISYLMRLVPFALAIAIAVKSYHYLKGRISQNDLLVAGIGYVRDCAVIIFCLQLLILLGGLPVEDRDTQSTIQLPIETPHD